MKMKLLIESFKKSLKENFPDNESSERSKTIVGNIMSLAKDPKTGAQAHSLIQGLEMSDDPVMKGAAESAKKEIEERIRFLKSRLAEIQELMRDLTAEETKELTAEGIAIDDELVGLDAALGIEPDGGMYFL